MHTGLGLSFQALDAKLSDADVYRQELSLAARAERDGFDSIWTPEHHFTDYMLTPNVTQFLSWVAGQTTRIRLGTVVTVLPWHDPVRVAESFILLDHLSQGRAVLGIGRGLGRVEFDAFRSEMAESRRRFTEYADAIINGLETGVMVIAQKPWETVQAELAAYRFRYLELNGEEAPKPILALFVGVSEDPAEAQMIRQRYLQRYARSTVEHYEFENQEFASIEGYEYYAGIAKNIAKHGLEKFNSFLADLQVWGTPDQVTEQILENARKCDAGALIVQLRFGGMAPELARRNYELFVECVLPALQAHDVGGDLGVSHGGAETLQAVSR